MRVSEFKYKHMRVCVFECAHYYHPIPPYTTTLSLVLVLLDRDQRCRTVDITDEITNIGRLESAHVRIHDDNEVSKEHCQVYLYALTL